MVTSKTLLHFEAYNYIHPPSSSNSVEVIHERWSLHCCYFSDIVSYKLLGTLYFKAAIFYGDQLNVYFFPVK